MIFTSNPCFCLSYYTNRRLWNSKTHVCHFVKYILMYSMFFWSNINHIFLPNVSASIPIYPFQTILGTVTDSDWLNELCNMWLKSSPFNKFPSNIKVVQQGCYFHCPIVVVWSPLSFSNVFQYYRFSSHVSCSYFEILLLQSDESPLSEQSVAQVRKISTCITFL